MKELDKEMKEKFRQYLEQRELMPRTIQDYLYYYDNFITFSKLTQEGINSYISKYKNCIARGFLKNFLKFLALNRRELEIKDEEFILIREIELPEIAGRKKNKDIDYLSYNEVKTLNMKIPEMKHKLLLALNFFGALRISELLNVKYSDFNWEEWARNGRTSILELKVYGKGGKYRIVFIPCAVAKSLDTFFRTHGKRLKKIKDENEKEILVEVPVFNLKRNTYQIYLNRFGKKYLGKSVHSHQLRHSFATYLLKKGWSLIKIKEYLGHADISTTQIYAHLDIADLKKDYEELGF